jgi:hypothetical protein
MKLCSYCNRIEINLKLSTKFKRFGGRNGLKKHPLSKINIPYEKHKRKKIGDRIFFILFNFEANSIPNEQTKRYYARNNPANSGRLSACFRSV